MADDSQFIRHVPCEKCGSSDANSLYDDGHQFCFACQTYHKADGSEVEEGPSRTPIGNDLLRGEVKSLGKRGLNATTCAKFSYTVGEDKNGRTCQIAPYYEGTTLVAQKLRYPDKTFKFIGEPKRAGLFGQQLWRDGGKMVVVTEGEIDCLTVSQLQNNKWPVVSIANGAQSAKKAISKHLEWLEQFETVVLMFDMDEAGKAAIEECAPLFTPGKCKVASLPLKDANEMLVAGRGSEVIDAIWGAKAYRPDGVVMASDLIEEACKEPVMGDPWFLDALTALTYGRRPGELYGFGAGTGVGKTDLFTQSMAFDLREGHRVGALYLEQDKVETLVRVAGKWIGRVLHVPGEAPKEVREAAIREVGSLGTLALYDSWGMNDWETVKAKMRYMIVSLGCTHIYLDHLTALVAGEEDENGALKVIMGELAGLAKTTGARIHYVSHLATPETGKPHEEGGRVAIRHFRGSRAIGFWTHFMFGLERDQQADDPEVRSTTIFRCLKDRNTGRATGKVLYLKYDEATGLLSETAAPPPQEEDNPFRNKPRQQAQAPNPDF